MSLLGTEGPGSSQRTPEYDAFLDPLSPETELLVCQYVREALGRFGSSGEVTWEGSELLLLSPAGVSRARVGSWVRRWEQLDENIRRGRALELARQLAQPRALAAATSVRSGSASWTGWVLAAAVAIAGLAAYFWFVRPDPASATDASASGPVSRTKGAAPTDLEERIARANRVCEATRARVLRGATVGITETDGWVVEFFGFQKDGKALLGKSPALAQFVASPSAPEGSAFIWKEEPQLATVTNSTTRVTLADEPITGSQGDTTPALRITFHGALVDAYFQPEERAHYYHLAHGLTEALGLTHSALYARCEAGRTHHLGSWFRGRNDAEAATSLLYFLGTYAEPPHLSPPFLHAVGGTELDRSVALNNIEHVAGNIDRALLASVLGRQGGMVVGKKNEGVTIAFPFRDGNRAARASRDLARLVDLNRD